MGGCDLYIVVPLLSLNTRALALPKKKDMIPKGQWETGGASQVHRLHSRNAIFLPLLPQGETLKVQRGRIQYAVYT